MFGYVTCAHNNSLLFVIELCPRERHALIMLKSSQRCFIHMALSSTLRHQTLLYYHEVDRFNPFRTQNHNWSSVYLKTNRPLVTESSLSPKPIGVPIRNLSVIKRNVITTYHQNIKYLEGLKTGVDCLNFASLENTFYAYQIKTSYLCYNHIQLFSHKSNHFMRNEHLHDAV